MARVMLKRNELEALLRERRLGATLQRACQDTSRRLLTGIEGLDQLLGGGFPRGCLTQWLGRPSSGRTSLTLAVLASASLRGEVVAVVDSSAAFDPLSAQRAGIVLSRLLWVRCNGPETGVKAAEVLVTAGGFGIVLLDLADHSIASVQKKIPPSCWYRLQHVIEGTPTVLVVLLSRPVASTVAAVDVWLSPQAVRWSGALPSCRLLRGLEITAIASGGCLATGDWRLATKR